jgi:parallel beta-helix repeat protein
VLKTARARSPRKFLAVSTLAQRQQVSKINGHKGVPGDQATIQGAINAGNPGDTVLVAPGTYSENINFNGKAITVTSSGGAAQTIIDGGGKRPVALFHTGEGFGSVLNGFTIQNGSSFDTSLGTSFDGAGISISSASPTVTNNVIQNNSGCDGGGMAVEFSSALVQGNTITNNNDFQCSGGSGAGLWIGGSGFAQIIGNVITNNVATSAGSGGGIVLFAAGTPTLRNNIIAGNTTGGAPPPREAGSGL